MLALLKKTCTALPPDVVAALDAAGVSEGDPIARATLDIIRESAGLSRAQGLPICQDTGALLALIKGQAAAEFGAIEEAILQAVETLTGEGILRQNCVDPLTEKNTGTNRGAFVPQVHVHPCAGPTTVAVMLKGGGSENMSTQYSLPHQELGAGRDFDGVRRCLLDAVYKAQGKGCAPGILGVCIGGDRASGYLLAKEQLFRKLDDVNPVEGLARLEQTVREEANRLGIGPMGLGGSTTLLGVKIAAAGRHPASYFVTISYSCWATRRYAVELAADGGIARWL